MFGNLCHVTFIQALHSGSHIYKTGLEEMTSGVSCFVRVHVQIQRQTLTTTTTSSLHHGLPLHASHRCTSGPCQYSPSD